MQVRPSLRDILAIVESFHTESVWVGFYGGHFLAGSIGTNPPAIHVSFLFKGRKSVKKALDTLEKRLVEAGKIKEKKNEELSESD